MEIWDHGSYELVERKRDGGLTVRLAGERLQGLWTLVPAHLGGDEKNWLVIKKRDSAGAARPGAAPAGYAPMLATPADAAARARALAARGEVGRLPRGGAARGRRRLADQPPRRRHGRALRRPSRGRCPTRCAPPTAWSTARCACWTRTGRPSFSLMQRGRGIARLLPVRPARAGAAAADRPAAGAASRAAGRAAGGGQPAGAAVGRVRGRARRCFRPSWRRTWRAWSPSGWARPTGRADGQRDWVKVKTPTGWSSSWSLGWTARPGLTGGAGSAGAGRGRRRRPGLGRQRRQRPGRAQHRRPAAPHGAAAVATPPLDPVPKMPKTPAAAGDLGRAAAGACRCSSRSARATAGCAPRYSWGWPRSAAPRRRARGSTLTNPDKVFFPDEGITKGDLFAYYEAVAPVVVPHLRDRPFTMLRYPGRHQRQAASSRRTRPSHLPAWVAHLHPRGHPLHPGERRGRAAVGGEHGLHRPASVAGPPRPARPARPGDVRPRPGRRRAVRDRGRGGAAGARGAVGARAWRASPAPAAARACTSWCRSSGAPTRPARARSSAAVARALARTHPDLITTKWRSRERHGVLIDANQNGLGRTTAAAYSVRPRPGATVATPLAWDELTPDLDPGGVHDGGRDRAGQPARRPRVAVARPPPAPALAAGLAGLFFLAGS